MPQIQIDPQETLAKIIEWEARHGFPMQPGEASTWRIVTVGGQRFALVYCLATDTYPTVWGYHVGMGDRLSCRHFYFSASEAAWRAGTGVRCTTSVDVPSCIASLRANPMPQGGDWEKLESVKPHGWVKSAEDYPGHSSSGYIYEGMVVNELHVALEDWYQRNKRDAIHQQVWKFPLTCYSDGKDNYIAMEKHVNLLINLVVSVEGKHEEKKAKGSHEKQTAIKPPSKYKKCNFLVTIYGEEREYMYVVPRRFIEADEEQRGRLKQPAPILQMQFKNTSAERGGIAHEIKRSTDLWGWINTCLTSQKSVGERRRHPELDTEHIITTYVLPVPDGGNMNIHVEIAETAGPMTLSYLIGGIVESEISTPVCWVRSVYLPNSEVTTFGTYKSCPIDLAFLVQKPCDYLEQTSEDHSALLGMAANIAVKDGRKVPVSFKPSQTPLARHNIVRKGGKDTYISLALFNETTSPLIKEYKRRKGYALFQYKYKTMEKVQKTFIADAEFIRQAMIKGVNEYLSLHDFRSDGHGAEGRARATVFLRLIEEQNYPLVRLSVDFHELFVNNRVNGSREGWNWFHKIRTGRQSLFTVVCRTILPKYCAAEWDPRILSLAAQTPLPRAADKSLQRLMHKAIALGIGGEGCEKQVEDHSAELLQAVQKSQ